jgi:hypothetical protein
MKKLQLAVLLFSTLTAKAQYYPDFTAMSFYSQYSGKQDLHYNDGWTRDTNSIVLDNSVLKVRIKNGTTHYIQTGLLNLKKDDIISFNHRISNSSGVGKVKISYVDSAGNEVNIKTITYNSANNNTLTDTVKVSGTKRCRVRFTFTKTSGNSSCRFDISSFSAVGLIPLPVKPIIEKPKQEIEIIEDEVLVYNIFGVCVYEGYLSEFYKIGVKGQVYFTNKQKFIIQ